MKEKSRPKKIKTSKYEELGQKFELKEEIHD
jgi:hypothetical protein